jgi:hypothetical protein
LQAGPRLSRNPFDVAHRKRLILRAHELRIPLLKNHMIYGDVYFSFIGTYVRSEVKALQVVTKKSQRQVTAMKIGFTDGSDREASGHGLHKLTLAGT